MLFEYRNNNSEKWDEIVKTFNNRDIYWCSGYTKSFELHGDGTPILLYYEGNNLRGINVVMKRDIAEASPFVGRLEKGTYYDLSTPYGYGGWLLEGDTSSLGGLRDELNSWYRDNGIVSEFYRFHPVLDNARVLNEEIEIIPLGKTVAIRLDDEQKIWERYSSKNRGHIRKAEKEGIIVKKTDEKKAIEVFKSIYQSTMNNDDADDYYYFNDDFYESISNDLQGKHMFYIAYLEDTPIAAAIMLFENRFMSYHLSGQLIDYRKYAGTNMILHEAAKWGCENGFEWLHLGGGLGAQEGPLYDFKKSFYKKGEDKEFFIGKKIVDMQAYEKLISMRSDCLKTNFFPSYRANL